MYWYSLTKTVIWANTAAAKQKRCSRKQLILLHNILYLMTCLCVRLSDVNTHDCAGLYVCVFVCSMQIERQDRLLPCCSLQGLWLARLSRTETSASICVAALRPYWWAATSCNRHALCRSTPPVGASRAGQETWEPPCETKLLCGSDTVASTFKMSCSRVRKWCSSPVAQDFFWFRAEFQKPLWADCSGFRSPVCRWGDWLLINEWKQLEAFCEGLTHCRLHPERLPVRNWSVKICCLISF